MLTNLPAAHAFFTVGSDLVLTTGDITGDTDVNSTGSLVYAASLQAGADPTVNGVSFDPAPFYGGSNTYTDPNSNFSIAASTTLRGDDGYGDLNDAPFSNLSDAYQDLLFTGFNADGGTLKVTLNGLMLGQTYLFQSFVNDSTGSDSSARTESVNDDSGYGNTVTLTYNTSGNAGGLGQYVTGIFVATSASEAIDFTGVAGDVPSAQINAFQLRAVPEPTTWALLIAGLGVLGVRRRFCSPK